MSLAIRNMEALIKQKDALIAQQQKIIDQLSQALINATKPSYPVNPPPWTCPPIPAAPWQNPIITSTGGATAVVQGTQVAFPPDTGPLTGCAAREVPNG